MRLTFVLILTLILSSCARDNPRIFGGIRADIKNESQIVLSYEPTFEMGRILKDTYNIAKEHCAKFGKETSFKTKDEGLLFTTVVFECRNN